MMQRGWIEAEVDNVCAKKTRQNRQILAAPTIFLQQHLKSATVVLWKTAPTYEQMLKMFASGEVNAYAGSRARLVEAADTYPGLRVVEDNFTVLEQNLLVPKGDAAKLKIINDFLDEARSSGFLKDMLSRETRGGGGSPSQESLGRRTEIPCES